MPTPAALASLSTASLAALGAVRFGACHAGSKQVRRRYGFGKESRTVVRNSSLVSRGIVAERGRTSMRLEPELWDALCEICAREQQDLVSLVRQIEAADYAGSRTSAVRVFVVQYFRQATNDVGHGRVNHVLSRPGAVQITSQAA